MTKSVENVGTSCFTERRVGGETLSSLTMNGFCHSSACNWLPRNKSESALKFRFGWKKSEQIRYYTELLGMSDTISWEDLLSDTTKIDLERKLEATLREKQILQDRLDSLQQQVIDLAESRDLQDKPSAVT